jgi:hypothetical protein
LRRKYCYSNSPGDKLRSGHTNCSISLPMTFSVGKCESATASREASPVGEPSRSI